MQALVALSLAIAVAGVVLNSASLIQLRNAVRHDYVMTTAMSVAMAAGLQVGIVAGVLAPTDLWLPTAVGAVGGAAAGLAVGYWTGLMTVLEGLMSGVMAGAMGAMMGGMMPGRAGPLLASATFLSAATSVLALLLAVRGAQTTPGGHDDHGGHEGHDGHDDHGGGKGVRLGYGPLWASVGAGAVVAVISWFALAPLVHRMPLDGGHLHSPALEVALDTGDFSFTPAEITLTVGQPVRLKVKNAGSQEHDLTIPGLEHRSVARKDSRAEPLGLHVFVRPGESGNLEFVPLRPGTYEGYCSVPGHKDLGMVLKVRVVSPAAP